MLPPALVMLGALLAGPAASIEPRAPAPAPPACVAEQQADVAELLDGVREIGAPGQPGNVVAFGPDAFAVVTGAGGAPVVAAARHGRGRAMVFGHGGYLSAGVAVQADQAVFLRNALRWLAGGKKKPSIATPGNAELALKLEELGFKASADLELKKADVVVQPENPSAARADELVDFVERGGGLMTAATGWGWQQLNPKAMLARDLPAQRLAVRFGLAFGTGTVGKTGATGYVVGPPAAEPPDGWSNAGNAYRGLRDGTVPDGSRAAASARVCEWLAAMPDHEPSLGIELRRWIEAGNAPKDIADAYAKRAWRPLELRLAPWYVIGPFRGGKSVADPAPPEKLLDALALDGPGPDLAGDLRGDGGRVAWQRLEIAGPGSDGGDVDAGIVRFNDALAAPPKADAAWTERACAYAYRRIDAGEARELALRLGADDGVRAWLNGELVVDRADAGGIELGEADVVLRLQRGVNHLLLKVRNESGPWGFRLRENTVLSQTAVNAAIDRGVAWLQERQLIDGSWSHEEHYGVGFSAYVLYALLKSGVDPDHAAVRRAQAYVEAHPGEYTYATACRILALSALDRGGSLEELRDSVDQLVSWQEGDGLYAYPLYPGGGRLPQDLSNTLYAALALHAAQKRGVRVPERTWEGLVEGTLRCWEWGGSTKSRRADGAAGFSYRPGGTPTGSMTTAGISVLAIGREELGDALDKRTAREVDAAIASGVRWVEENLAWDKNPGQPQRWHLFFLYGVERIGALLHLDVLGNVSWYWSGAEYLIGAQGKDGNWTATNSGEGPADTVLALLFLSKATAPVSGRAKISDRKALSAAGDVAIQAVGTDPLAVWISGWSAERRAELGPEPRVMRVEWIVRDASGAERVAAVVEGGGDGRGGVRRYEARIALGGAGRFLIFARVAAEIPPAEVGLTPRPTTLESPPIELELASGDTAPFADYARDAERNLLRGAAATASASTQAGGQAPANAIDGLHGTRWACAPSDAQPVWRVELIPAQTGRSVLLSHALPMPKDAGGAQAADLEVVINGSDRYALTTDPDPHAKTVLTLPADVRVSKLEIRVLSVRNGTLGSASVGFSEIELL